MSAPDEAAPARADEPAVVVEGLRTAFGERVIHENLDLTVRRGEVLGVVGGSGSGKTVLLNTILGLKAPDAGEVRLFGQSVADLPRGERDQLEKRCGIMFQHGALFSALTVVENVASPMVEHAALPADLVREIAELKIAMVGLGPESHHLKPAELSGGMRKRVGLARALSLDPELLFLDEPTAGLDPIGAAAFDRLLRSLRDDLDLTVFMITHDLDTLYAVCDRVAVLAEKRVVAVAPPRELEQSDHPWVRDYFLGPRGRAARASAEGAR